MNDLTLLQHRRAADAGDHRSRWQRLGRRGSLPIAAAIVAAVAPAASPGQSHGVLSGFVPSGEYQLTIDGEPVDAEIALSQRAAALLVESEVLPAPLLVFARTQRVDQVAEAGLLRGDDEIDLREDAERTYVGDFTQDGHELILPAPENARLRPKPPLLGPRELGDLLQHSPAYRTGMREYRVDPAQVAKLTALEQPVRVRIVFGSWCGHCKHYLPHALKLEESLRGAGIDFDYYGIDYPPEGWQDAEVRALEVTGLPTAIVYRGDREVGRFTGAKGFERIESTLVDLLD
ncbi:MAG: thioredoxin family protein [Acidobacteria bacterium]|nr:MAG: thioredoxin family protein [Acidobacteriota bacterium]REK08880.1 MAG: thioredoxin family protein [Acidobacteriota bacterium]